jgi:hypothetical protein
MEPENKEARMRADRKESSILQASCGRERAIGSMENRCELLINLVNDDKPKMLTGLHQKVGGQVAALAYRCTQPL